MKLSVTQENLARALGVVGRVASNRAGLPILNNILFRTEGNRLLLAATNLEIAATYYIGAKVETPGVITLPAKLVSEFVANLPKGPIELETDGTRMTLTSGGYTSTINGVVADDFPELPTIDEEQSVRYSIAAVDFKQAAAQTLVTCSNDTTRPVLTGVYWHTVDGVLTGVYWHTVDGALYMAATDGYRLAERRLMASQSQIAAIVPASSLQEALRSLSDGTEEVEVLFDETQVRFRLEEVEITSRLIDGTYPNYRQLIPAQSETNVTLAAGDFSRVVKVAGLFARESGGSVTLTADHEAQKLRIHSVASELGENTSEAEAEVSSDGQITLNSRYISDALGVLDGETITFRFSGKLSPCVLTTAQPEPNYIHIIMPLKS